MLTVAPCRPDGLLRETTGGTTMNDLRIVSAGTQLPVVLLTLQIRIWYVPTAAFGTLNVVAHVDDPGKKKLVRGMALPLGSQVRRISSSPLPGTQWLPETLMVCPGRPEAGLRGQLPSLQRSSWSGIWGNRSSRRGAPRRR